MSKAQLQAELERREVELLEIIELGQIELRGVRAQLEAIREGTAGQSEIATMSRTDAIIAVLRLTGGALTPREIVDTLMASGRDDEYNSVGATLGYLLDRGRVVKRTRGSYEAT